MIPNLERRYKETDSATIREELAKLQNIQPCPACDWHAPAANPHAMCARGEDDAARTFARNQPFGARDTLAYFQSLELSGAKREIADRIIKEITLRLQF